MEKFPRMCRMLRASAVPILFAFLVLSETDFCCRTGSQHKPFWNVRVQAFSVPASRASTRGSLRHRTVTDSDSFGGKDRCLGFVLHNNRVGSIGSSSSSSSSSRRNAQVGDGDGDGDGNDEQRPKIRLNKVFKRTHSRREADRLIEEGRVSVNGEPVTTKGGFFVVPYVDEVSLDGNLVEGWEEMNFVVDNNNNDNNANTNSKIPKAARNDTSNRNNNANANLPKKTTNIKKQTQTQSQTTTTNTNTNTNTFEYIKYWKPRGVICTTDPNIPHNIVEELAIDGYFPPHRVYPVGRLDKDTSGLILVTSDGRLPNAALRKQHKRPKVYEVGLDRPISDPDRDRVLRELSTGVTISTETVRNGIRKTLTAPTEPCKVEQLSDRWLRITLREGRNRQVRKMTRAVGYRTVELERVSFAGIELEPGLREPGDWDYLKGEELEIVTDMIETAEAAAAAEVAALSTETDEEEWSSSW